MAQDALKDFFISYTDVDRKWAEWISQPMDESLLAEVQTILRPIHNWFYIEGRPENNDPS